MDDKVPFKKLVFNAALALRSRVLGVGSSKKQKKQKKKKKQDKTLK